METYAPYVMGYADNDDDETTLDDVIELLKASSESHGDDEEAWITFRNELMRRRKEFLEGEDARRVSSKCKGVLFVLRFHVCFFSCFVHA